MTLRTPLTRNWSADRLQRPPFALSKRATLRSFSLRLQRTNLNLCLRWLDKDQGRPSALEALVQNDICYLLMTKTAMQPDTMIEVRQVVLARSLQMLKSPL